MSSEHVPVLWIWGPPGVGKTTIGWEIWSELSAAGITAAYVDIDQLGMSVPMPAHDPQRYRLKTENLAAVVPNYRAAGARLVVVSGTCDIEHTRTFAARTAVTLCRLQLDHDELRARLAGRGWDSGFVDAAIVEAVELDASTIAEVSVDSTGLSVAEVVASLREQVGGWPLAEAAAGALPPSSGADAAGDILWLCGPTGVGKSTIGWEVFIRAWRDGRRVALIDLQQIGFLEPSPADDPDNHRLKAQNLAAIWSTIRADGADSLVMVGSVDNHDQLREYVDALPAAAFTLVRLSAGRDQLAERIIGRGDGKGPRIPGDRLFGRDPVELAHIADEAAAAAVRLACIGIGDVVIDTDRLTVDEVTDSLRRQIGNWPRA